jgi:hypothetical protein
MGRPLSCGFRFHEITPTNHTRSLRAKGKLDMLRVEFTCRPRKGRYSMAKHVVQQQPSRGGVR